MTYSLHVDPHGNAFVARGCDPRPSHVIVRTGAYRELCVLRDSLSRAELAALRGAR